MVLENLEEGLWISIVLMILYFSFSIVKVLRFWLMIGPAWRISVLIIVDIVALKLESRLGSKFSPTFWYLKMVAERKDLECRKRCKHGNGISSARGEWIKASADKHLQYRGRWCKLSAINRASSMSHITDTANEMTPLCFPIKWASLNLCQLQ